MEVLKFYDFFDLVESNIEGYLHDKLICDSFGKYLINCKLIIPG